MRLAPRSQPALAALALAVTLFAGGFAGCSGEGETLERARASIAAGDLEHADRLAAEVQSSDGVRLREEIAKLIARRDKLPAEIDALFARSGELTQNEVRDQLKRMRERANDKSSRDVIDHALSAIVERYSTALAQRKARGEAPTPAQKPSSSATAELIASVRSDVREALDQKQWQRAQSLLTMLADQPRERLGDITHLRDAVRDGSKAEAEHLVAQAHDIERDVSSAEAHTWLRKHAERFPPSREFEMLFRLVADLEERAHAAPEETSEEFELFQLADGDDETGEAAAAEAALAVGEAPEPPDLEAQALVALARERAAQGELAFARKCWLAASGKLFAGDLRDDCVGEAQDIRARLALRHELAEAQKADRATFERLGVTSIDAGGLNAYGEEVAWNAAPFDLLQRLASSVALSHTARRGVIAEVLRSADAGRRDAAASELARMVERGAIDADTAAGMISRAMGGAGASQRYLLAKGAWSPFEEVAAADAAAIDDQLQRQFLRANPQQRDAALQALVKGASLDTLRASLAQRTVAAVGKLIKTRTLDQLEAVAELRREVDAKRAKALELIFDEKTYFYPYNPPEPPNTATDYVRAQRAVNEAVDALRESWTRSKPAKLAKDFRAALDELDWCKRAHEELQLGFALPEELPAWVAALPREFETIDVAQFAWTPAEAAELRQSRLVEARNERLWRESEAKTSELTDAQKPNVAEREQVRITNRYRAMFGRRSVAWNLRIQAAAQWHSDYMANTGDFGHFEKDPETRTPGDRMRREGYNAGVSENCAMVGGDPQAAHDGWTQSSGHHRNLLMAGHREMASASASNYWTQNFGADRAFEKDLEPQGEETAKR